MIMEQQALFDALTIAWSDRLRHRRAVLRLLGQFVVAVVVFGAFPWRVQPAAASQLVKGCKLPGQKCSGKHDCCAPKCGGDHRCGCIKKGKKPLVKTPLGPVPVKALCCTNKLNKLKGTCK
jgi:hypothetical protein